MSGKWKYWGTGSRVMLMSIMLMGCCQDTYSLLTLQSQDGYVFDIRGRCFVEITEPILCQIMKNEEIIIRKGLGVTRHAKDLEFALIESASVFAIIETANPQVVFGLFDRQIDQYWTCMTDREQAAAGNTLLQTLNNEQSGPPFVLCRSHTLKHEPIP